MNSFFGIRNLGTLNEIAVTDVQEKDGEIVHHTEVALEVGSEADLLSLLFPPEFV